MNDSGILGDRVLVNVDQDECDAVVRVHLRGTLAPSHCAAAYWRDRSKAGESNDASIITTRSAAGIYGKAG